MSLEELRAAVDKWDNDRIDLDPIYVEPIMEAAREKIVELSKGAVKHLGPVRVVLWLMVWGLAVSYFLVHW